MSTEAHDFFNNIIQDLNKHNIDYIICGGVAVVLHGVERLTMDIDISLDMTDNNIKSFLKIMEAHTMTPRAPIPAESLLDKDLRKAIVAEKGAVVFTFIDSDNPFKQLDLFLTDDLSFSVLKNDCIDIHYDEGSVTRVLSIDKLIDLKSNVDPQRQKDLFDINELEKLKRNK